jgi:hypothetical protein
MATTFKKLIDKDVTSTRTLLHEVVPMTGGIMFATYSPASSLGDEVNVKKFSHGMFESVFDYPYLSSSANHIFDISIGYSGNSVMSSSANTQNAKKINLYTQMAQLLAGHNISGSIQDFDADGNLGGNTGGANFKMKEAIFLPFSRLLVKDEIKKGSFSMDLAIATGSTEGHKPFEITGGAAQKAAGIVRVSDTNAANDYYVN